MNCFRIRTILDKLIPIKLRSNDFSSSNVFLNDESFLISVDKDDYEL